MLQDQQIDGQPLYRIGAQYVAEQSIQHSRAERLWQCRRSRRGHLSRTTCRTSLCDAQLVVPGPGYGSQGGTAKDTAAAFDSQGLGAVINNSRGIIFAHQRPEYRDRFGDSHWQDAVAAATEDMIAQLRAETAVGKL